MNSIFSVYAKCFKQAKQQLIKTMPAALMLVAATSFASCLGDDDTTTYSYDDTAITSFALSKIKRIYHTTSSTGKDSTYTGTLTATAYKFNINQITGEIYNPDSLPLYVDASRALCNVYALNSGVITVKNVDSDSLTFFSSTDSIDFTKERTFRVYSYNGTAYKDYTVKLNVHKEDSAAMNWHELTPMNSSLGSLTAMRAVCLGQNIIVMGTDGTDLKIYSSAISDGSNWGELTPNQTIAPDAYKNIVKKGDYIYVLSNGDVLRSANGADWQVMGSNAAIKSLLAAGSNRMFALATGGILVSEDDGATWTADKIDDADTLLPTQDIAYAVLKNAATKDVEQIMVVGNRNPDVYKNDTAAVVWNRVNEYGNGVTDANQWMYYPVSSKSKYLAPHKANWQTTVYDGRRIIAACGEDVSKFQISEDGGLTWKVDTTLAPPAASLMNYTLGNYALTIDSDNYLWIIGGGTGQVWRGRQNGMGWKKSQKYFDK